MSARTETLAEVIDWLGDEADREWERAKDGLSDGYGGFDAYTRAIQHCQDMIVEVVAHADSGKLGLYRKSDGKPLQPVGEE